MRGTAKKTEAKRRGGVQAHHRVGSLKPLQGLDSSNQLSKPASAQTHSRGYFPTVDLECPTESFSAAL